MFDDFRYKLKAKELSAIYHDRVMKPGAEIPHWVEYVVRTRGAKHLRSPALSVSLYQRLYLDLLALLVLIVFAIQKIIKYILKLRSQDSSKKNKKD